MKISSKIKIASLAVLSISLSACAIYPDNQTACNKVGGVGGCHSLGDIYDATESGAINASNAPYTVNGKVASGTASPMGGNAVRVLPAQGSRAGVSGYDVVTPNIGQPVRNGDTIQKITVFPYQDKNQNYYETAIMYTILNQSHWVGYPTSSVIDEDDEFED